MYVQLYDGYIRHPANQIEENDLINAVGSYRKQHSGRAKDDRFVYLAEKRFGFTKIGVSDDPFRRTYQLGMFLKAILWPCNFNMVLINAEAGEAILRSQFSVFQVNRTDTVEVPIDIVLEKAREIGFAILAKLEPHLAPIGSGGTPYMITHRDGIKSAGYGTPWSPIRKRSRKLEGHS